MLIAGTVAGSNNLNASGVTGANTATVTAAAPASGTTVYVRAFSKLNGVWYSND